ncbi:hypothetical protein SAMN04488028_10515 [Reichenbachiella agariperforans]|uniref:Uncharacterized protein n=1 Tax=Reichenbachiella agariperforans TaxID=156994 RepID=A0A1M6SGM5_REIAG|nr:glycoside hydrolase family 127 protein [Reichenbachiella agariperforans]SHK43944.1 hypothetical protein SAMN04488028_10515 [Reichenbachiella agariperforans]
MKDMKTLLCMTAVWVTFWSCTPSTQSKAIQKLEYFSLEDVRLLESPFLHAQELDKQYLLELNADRLLAPFLREAGLKPKAENYTNWENTGLDGHIGGHYLSALSQMYASTGDQEIKNRLDFMLTELNACQQANNNGYIGGVPDGKVIWKEIAQGNIRAGAFGLNDRWVPLYNIHKTYAGLRDAYLYTGSIEAKGMLINMTDWMIEVVSQLSDEQIQDMLVSEHGGLNETFADVAAITGDKKYLKLAKQFSHQVLLAPLIKGEDHLTGMHANTQIPKVIGFQRVAEINGDSSWTRAARFFWEQVVNDRSVSIGGNSAYEHFHPSDDFNRMIQGTQGPETCNTYNMLRLTRSLYQDSPNADYIDYYERALYNHILSSQNPETGGLVYFTQMRPGHYRVYSQPQTSFWCCVGSGIENHAKYGEMIYAHTKEALYVNLFIPSEVEWKERGVKIFQENNFPQEAETKLTIASVAKGDFTLQLRNPEWIHGELEVWINGTLFTDFDASQGYLALRREWKEGDEILVKMPMKLHTEQLPDGSNYYSFLYGPIVLAAKTSNLNMPGLNADDSRGGHIASGRTIPIHEMPMLLSDTEQLLENVAPIPGRSLQFQLTGLYPEKYNQGLQLIPFYTLHDARYMVYFPQANQDELEEIKRKMSEKEEAVRQLDAVTVDIVLSGQQQPESDHFVQQQDTWTGYMYDEHYREGTGWFSYQMKNPEIESSTLYVKYLDVDPLRRSEIYLNDQKVADLDLDAKSKEHLNILTIDIPVDIRKEKLITVKIKSKEGKWMTKIVEVRLLSEKATQ